MLDRLKTYELIKASHGVVNLESFILIEASLLEKPVIFWGHENLPADFYNREENVNQKMRLDLDMSSTLEHPEFKPKQAEVVSQYLFDGNNTSRVVNFLRRSQWGPA
jgi:CDP-glycerol glycerophosphotransferase (TagB/SpsB family)